MDEPMFHGEYSFNTGELNQFTPYDYTLFIFTLVASASIGGYFAWKDRNRKNMKEFLLAGKSMSAWPVGLSLLASFMSAITLLGTPAEMYNYTTVYWWIGVGYFLVIAGAAHIYIPVFYHLGVTSAYEYLELRFSQGVRTAASMTFVLQMIFYMAIVLYAPSLALNAVTGFSLWGSVIAIGVVCTIYTAFGGMKAVLWTDCFQVFMMIVSLLAVLIKGAMVVGGIGPALESAERANRAVWEDFSPNPATRHSVWSLVIGGYFTWVAIFGVNQAQVQRCITCKSLKDAKIAIWLNFPGLCIILYLCCIIGLFMSAFYEKCDPLKLKFISNSNQLLPLFVMDILGGVVGLPGLFVAGLFSGALSTISSGLNAIAAVVLEDVVKAYISKNIHEAKAHRLTQLIAIAFGAICLVLTIVVDNLGQGVLQLALSIFGMIGGPLLGLFSLGMFFPWANKWGGLTGLVTGLLFMMWIVGGTFFAKPPQLKSLRFHTNCNFSSFDNETMDEYYATKPPHVPNTDPPYDLYTLSYMWYSATAVLWVITVGLIISFITGATDPKKLDPRLICPLFDHIFPFMYLPEFILKPLRFGVIHEGKHDVQNHEPAEMTDMVKSQEKNSMSQNGHHDSDTEANIGLRTKSNGSDVSA